MEKNKIDIFVNGIPQTETIAFSGDTSIVYFLERTREKDNTIVALLNSKERVLDVFTSEDDYLTIHALTRLILKYPSDISDTYLYGIAKSSYANMSLKFIRAQYKMFKALLKKDDSYGLVKKDNQIL